ncbi:hypothetical protein PENSTE_c013G09313 [Penicillium steckii]|uniref:Major facilitator superfamily (MFS) profile domain-containing protein n=1 Tax=Penicillium steckii TaxID=303698 RepID=A0A1V6T2X7_9EURO|nr:hypothetical protein PENSTE_c013G09313 [Penicillium steckii]
MSEKTPQQQVSDGSSRLERGDRLSNIVTDSRETIDSTNKEIEDVYPEGGLRAWLVVAGSFLTLFCSLGMQSSIGVLQAHWESDQLKTYAPGTIGWITSVFVYLNMCLAVQVGPMFDKYGPRWILLIGSLLFSLTMFLLGSCKTYYQFILCLGGLGGLSGAMVTTPSMVVLSHWFNRRRGMATGIAMVGASLGGIAVPLILRSTIPALGWGWALRIVGFIFLGLLSIGNICIKTRLPNKQKKGGFSLQSFKDSRFVWFTAAQFFGQIVLVAGLGLIPSYAIAQGFSSDTSFYLMSVYNGGAAVGRGLSGFVCDRFGRFNTMATIMAITTVFIFVIWYPFGHYVGVLYAFVVLMGFGTGAILCLIPVCIAQMCKTEEVGQWLGNCYLIISHGSLVAVPIGGQLLKAIGPSNLVIFIGAMLAASFTCLSIARWACLGYHWKWFVTM